MHFLTLRKLKSPDWDVRCAGVFELAQSKSNQRIPLLLDALRDNAHGVRSAAAEALGVVRDPRAIKALKDALNDENESVRTIAAKSLESLGWKKEHYVPAKAAPAEIFVQCSCGAGLTVSSKYAGRTGKCSNCGAMVMVPFLDPVPEDKAA
jgi:hypothetical protein